LGVAYVIYTFMACAVTLSVSYIAATSRQALTILLLLWFTNCLLAPRLAADLAAHIAPELPPVAFQTKLDRELEAVSEKDRERTRQQMAAYHVTSQGELPDDVKAAGIQESEAEAKRASDEVFASLYQAHRQQERLFEAGGGFAPMLAIQTLSMGLAGGDIASYQHFAEEASKYRYLIENTLNEEGSRSGAASSESGREVWERIPPFKYEHPSLAWCLRQHSVSVLALCVWLLASGALVGFCLHGWKSERLL
jgi:ABC-2 type transport system permease protein